MSRLYEEDLDSYVALPGVALAIVLIVPGGWLLARLVRIAHPLRTALLAPMLLWVLSGAAELAVPHPSPRLVLLEFAALAVVSYASAAQLTATTSLVPRVIAAGMVCACVVTTATIQERRAERQERRLRNEYVAHLRESLPLAVPAVVPGRRLVRALPLTDQVLELAYAKDRGSEPDVYVRITGNEDPRRACSVWNVRDVKPGCVRLAADRWLWRYKPSGRMVLFSKVGHRLVEVDSTSLTLDEALVAGSKLRAVSAEYLADVGDRAS
ncbi:hypothetical protein [Nonomuraea africana]|uniref:Uncharacterized protein n=1 Tax=Nonomuraea africana TaxID=46171 RepID=A0ABR9KU69_9ACTN|nr:hypothetical protein [Nonomuraea africana]MBE1565286.1 hypothetical protein [Nonomuraea africana]